MSDRGEVQWNERNMYKMLVLGPSRRTCRGACLGTWTSKTPRYGHSRCRKCTTGGSSDATAAGDAAVVAAVAGHGGLPPTAASWAAGAKPGC